MATHSNILAWRITWTQSTGLQKVRHDWATNTFTFGLIIRYYLKQENSRKLAINKWILKTMCSVLESVFSYTLYVDNMHRTHSTHIPGQMNTTLNTLNSEWQADNEIKRKKRKHHSLTLDKMQVIRKEKTSVPVSFFFFSIKCIGRYFLLFYCLGELEKELIWILL